MQQKTNISSSTEYTEEFFELVSEGSFKSAQVILPIVVDLIQPRSVIDVGCGQGTWLSILTQLGIQDILGLDGDYIDRNSLKIPENHFSSQDLNHPFQLNRSFDLVISLEVAEHLPEENSSSFVESLTRLGKVILFSAAIPLQGGIGHINEQWQDYWAEKFEQLGYETVDCIRNKVWDHPHVDFWSAQNTLLFVDQFAISNYPKLEAEYEKVQFYPLSIVHPKKYLEKHQENQELIQTVEHYKHASNPQNWSLRDILSILPIVTFNGIKRTIKNLIGFNMFK